MDLEELMAMEGRATFQRRKPLEDLNKYVPIRVTEANIGTDKGVTPNQLFGGPDYTHLVALSTKLAQESPETIPEWLKRSAPREQSSIFVSNNLDKELANAPNYREYVKQHEQSHVLSNRANPQGVEQAKHPLYKTVGAGAADYLHEDLRRALKKNKLSLMARYPELMYSAYIMQPEKANLEEIMADLNAIEDTYGVDLTEDPALQQAFRSTRNKELYRASTGYRRTRMDARDPEPYNPKGYR